MMYRLSRGCFVFLLVMLAWSAVRFGMIASGFDHSLLGCGIRDYPAVDCDSALLTYLLNAPGYFFFLFPAIGLLVFKALLTFEADFFSRVIASPEQALFIMLAVIGLAVLILGLFVFPYTSYHRWRGWW